jgi:nitrate reductase (NAD(P)H)
VLVKLCNLHWPSEEEGYNYDAYEVEDRYLWMVGADELPNGNYGTCIPLGLAMNMANDVILAYKCNGALLPPDRGFPLRMIIPGWIGGKLIFICTYMYI